MTVQDYPSREISFAVFIQTSTSTRLTNRKSARREWAA